MKSSALLFINHLVIFVPLGLLVSPSESVASPVVDRSTKPPPMVNRAAKPKTGKENHSYCNMPPKVDRELKYKSGTIAPPEHNYMNYGFHPPQRPQHLPLVKTLPGNHSVGAFPNQTDRWSSGPTDDADYLPMQPPTRSETTRCYSFTKEEKPGSRAVSVDQCYEDMSALQTRRYSGGKSSSSSTSSLADNDELYMAMAPSQVSTVTKSISLGLYVVAVLRLGEEWSLRCLKEGRGEGLNREGCLFEGLI